MFTNSFYILLIPYSNRYRDTGIKGKAMNKSKRELEYQYLFDCFSHLSLEFVRTASKNRKIIITLILDV